MVKKKYASWYTPLPRLTPDIPGILIQMDTIHFVKTDTIKFYVYAFIDVYSRLAYAEYQPKLSQEQYKYSSSCTKILWFFVSVATN